MTHESREILCKASGILEGMSVSEELTEAVTNMIVAVSEMIDSVLYKEDTE